jgi:acyl carrier protein
VDIKEVNDETRFVEDLGADSIDLVELRLALEEEFDVEIPEDAAESILTVGAAAKFVNSRTVR